MTLEGDQVTPEGDQITLEGDHCEMMSRNRLMPVSPVKYTEYYVHIG